MIDYRYRCDTCNRSTSSGEVITLEGETGVAVSFSKERLQMANVHICDKCILEIFKNKDSIVSHFIKVNKNFEELSILQKLTIEKGSSQ